MAKDGKRGLTLEQHDFWDTVFDEGEARVLVVAMQIAFSALELIGYIPNVDRAFEAAAHGFFSGIRIRGEWFQESSIIRSFVAHYGR